MNVPRKVQAQCLRGSRIRGAKITAHTLWGFLLFCVCLWAVQNTGKLTDNFNKDREEWQSYDFTGGIAGGGNVFFPVTWEKSGGVNSSGHIWTDDSRWRIDFTGKRGMHLTSGYALDSRRPHTLWSATAATAPSRGHRAAVVGPTAAAHCAPRGDGSG